MYLPVSTFALCPLVMITLRTLCTFLDHLTYGGLFRYSPFPFDRSLWSTADVLLDYIDFWMPRPDKYLSDTIKRAESVVFASTTGQESSIYSLSPSVHFYADFCPSALVVSEAHCRGCGFRVHHLLLMNNTTECAKHSCASLCFTPNWVASCSRNYKGIHYTNTNGLQMNDHSAWTE